MSLLAEAPPAHPRDPSPELPAPPASQTNSSGGAQLSYAIAIFLSAFLLFQVQLLLGKQILPIFGGAPAVWTACILVFQLFFLAGYGYSHGLATRLPLRTQVFLHCGFLGFSLAVLAVLSHFRSTPVGLG